ncbi:GNAT family N-acetyltransferase [Hellea balneolensis]|uniref:GNAT family N-acetyltransferase n=1 Tax=Hellea balneolensis TaxID=287478 RepID=UPI00042702ED|nr:N-acetyltransferase [Hellea balneolensis]
MSGLIIRHEIPADYDSITQVNDLAFEETAQSRIIYELRKSGEALWSKVLVKDGEIIGHLLFYKIWLDDQPIVAGLGPIAIHPEHQHQGYGGQLIRDGLKEADPEEHQIIFLLGHTSYYPRFGFSSEVGAQYVSPWPRPAFMGLKLNDAAPKGGTLTFPKAYL